MCFTTCYWGLLRRRGRSSSCCHLKSSPTSSRQRTVCLLHRNGNLVCHLMLQVVLELTRSKRGLHRLCKTSRLPAHMLCCILMKPPLFSVTFLFTSSFLFISALHLFVCLFGHACPIYSFMPLTSVLLCSKTSRQKMKKTCAMTLRGFSRQWRWLGSFLPPRSSE